MKSRNKVIREYQYSDTLDGNTSSYESVLVDSYFDALEVRNDGQQHGDHETPGPQEFRKTVSFAYDGKTAIVGNSYSRLVSGPTGVFLPAADEPYDPNVFNDAIAKVYDRVRGSADLSVDLLQGKQALQMLSSTAALVRQVKSFDPFKLAQYYAGFQKNIREGRKLTRGVGSKWLEFQYGWKPLAQTIYDSAVELQTQRPPVMRITERAKGKNSSSLSSQGPYNGGSVQLETSSRCLVQCEFGVNASSLNLLSNFTSVNPVSIAWELTPYSFVVDWFLDIGGYMRSFESSVLNGSNFRGGFITETYQVRMTGKEIRSFNTFDKTVSVSYEASSVTSGKRRTLLLSAPTPRIPQFKNGLGSGRLLNAASLLSQHLNGGKR